MKKAAQILLDVLALYIEGSKMLDVHLSTEEAQTLTTSQKIELLEKRGIEV